MDIRITHVISLDAALMSVLMASVSGTAISAPTGKPSPSPAPVADAGNGAASAETAAPAAGATAPAASTDDGTLDAAGWPWDPSLHASTKGTTKDGLWRMKVGVSRPEPKPGFPKADGAPARGTGAPATSTAAAQAAASPTPAASVAGDDDDEFAAFRAAADASNATDAAAAGAVTARKWTDADLGALCNQAAVKLGDPAPVKELIAAHVPAGEVPHSRNIPEAKREEFAKAVEAKAGIEFAG